MSVTKSSLHRRLGRALLILAVLYSAVCGLMVAFEESLLFHPTTMPTGARDLLLARTDVEALELVHDEVTLRGFFVTGAGDGPRPTVLYFGGNAEGVWRRVENVPGPIGARFHRAYLAYRGYDDSSGRPAAAELLADALAFYDHVAARPDVDGDAIVVRGTSLGTGLATHVARHRPVAGVVLLAPYDRLADVAAGHYPWLPVRALMRNDIDSAAKASAITAPALIAHGHADQVIPIAHGQALAAAWAGPVETLYLDHATHDDLGSRPRTSRAIEAFLADLALTHE